MLESFWCFEAHLPDAFLFPLEVLPEVLWCTYQCMRQKCSIDKWLSTLIKQHKPETLDSLPSQCNERLLPGTLPDVFLLHQVFRYLSPSHGAKPNILLPNASSGAKLFIPHGMLAVMIVLVFHVPTYPTPVSHLTHCINPLFSFIFHLSPPVFIIFSLILT